MTNSMEKRSLILLTSPQVYHTFFCNKKREQTATTHTFTLRTQFPPLTHTYIHPNGLHPNSPTTLLLQSKQISVCWAIGIQHVRVMILESS